MVGNLPAYWKGPDAQRFGSEWSSHRSALTAAAQRLSEVGSAARRNVAEQNHASGITDAAGSVATSAPSPAAGVSVPAATPSSAHTADVDAFVKKWNGHPIDYDKAFGNQCFDVFRQYSKDVVGNGNIGTTSINAADIYNHYDRNGAAQYYDRIPAGQGQPQPGDVIVYGGTGSNSYGHVAVVTDVSGSQYTVLQQSGNTPDKPAWQQTYPMGSTVNGPVLGYLRPKG